MNFKYLTKQVNHGKFYSLSIKSSIMRVAGSLTFLDAPVGGYNLENNERMNIGESAKQTTCSTAEILNIKFGSAARVEQELSVPLASHVQHRCFALKVLIGLSLPSGMQFTSTFENAQASLLT